MPTQNEVWQALLSAFPEPDDVDAYVPALYYSQMADALASLAKVYSDAFSNAVYTIKKNAITSEVYTIVEHFRETRKVNLALVREDHPDIYADLIHVDGRTAQSILGADVLFSQCVEKAGEAAVLEKAVITVRDLEEALGIECAVPYLMVQKSHDRFEVTVK